MNKKQFTASIHLKGWSVEDALSRWGRSQDWYHRNTNGTEKQKQRLEDMIKGLPEQGE
tara:strand:- start:766 stop:939 length:174 start_codon:yes stop_codon:yes gene_type:complete